jgi:signal transduction histidine kinase
MPGSIAARLFLSYLGVVAVGLLAATLAIAALLVRYENDVTRQRLVEVSAPFLVAAQTGVRQGRTSREVIQSLGEQARETGTRLLVLGPQGRVLVDSEARLEGQLFPTMQRPDGEVGVFQERGEEWIFVQRQLGPAGIAVVARPRAVFADTVRTLLPALLASAAIAAAAALLAAALLARTITRPLRELAASVRRFAASRYRTRVATGGPTEVRQLGEAFNQMAHEVERARGSEQSFLADISHELRTPLTSIHGFAQAIVDEEVRGEGVGWAARVIQRETKRLVRMVEGLLQVAKLEAGTQATPRERVALEQLLGGAVAALEVQAREAQVVIEPQIAPLPPVFGDADRLSQLFLNVLDNALKHAPAGTRVRVDAATRDGEAVISVRDQGPGLPPGDEGRLFERFYRGRPGIQGGDAEDGAGLGLAIAQAIAQAHGGRIEARNAEPGGAEFSIHLPAASG